MLKIENIQRLDLGIQGENLSRAIEIDCGLWKDLIPNGTVSIYHRRPGDTALDVTGSTYDYHTGILRWEPTAADTFYAGTGFAEIRITEDEIVKKTAGVVTVIHPAVTGGDGGTIESNQQAYINEVNRLKSQITVIMQQAEEFADDAEAWAVGSRNGTPVTDEDEAYQNNSKYWADEASDSATAAADSESDAADSAEAAEGSAEAAAGSAGAAEGSAGAAADSEAMAQHWAEMALQGAEESGFAWFAIEESDGCMYVTVSSQLKNVVSFQIDENSGNLLVSLT